MICPPSLFSYAVTGNRHLKRDKFIQYKATIARALNMVTLPEAPAEGLSVFVASAFYENMSYVSFIKSSNLPYIFSSVKE